MAGTEGRMAEAEQFIRDRSAEVFCDLLSVSSEKDTDGVTTTVFQLQFSSDVCRLAKASPPEFSLALWDRDLADGDYQQTIKGRWMSALMLGLIRLARAKPAE